MKGKQASKTAGASRLGLAVLSRHPCGGRAVPVVLVSLPVVSSPPHPLIHGKQAGDGGTGRPRGVGVGLVLSFRRGGNDTGAGVPHHPHGGLPIRASFPHPSPYRKENHGKQAGRRRRGGLDDRIPAGKRRTSKQDENDEQPHPVSYHPTAPRHHTVPHLISHQRNRPAHSTSTQRDARTRRPENDGTKTHGPAKRQASNETTDETHDNKTEDETRRRRQGQKQARMGDENMRSGKNKTPHFLTFRPTPSRRLSIIRRPQSVPPPPVGG